MDPCVCYNVPLGTDAQFLNGIPFDPETLNAFEVGFKSTIGGTTTFNASAFYYDYEDYQAFVQLGDNQTIINLPATTYGLEAEIDSHPVDGLTLQLGISALGSNVEDIVLPDTVTEVEHDMPQAPDLSGNALARYEFALGGPGGRPVHRRFLLYGPVRSGREGKGLHRPERAGRVRGPERALGGRGLRRQPHRRGIPRVRVRQLAVCGCRGRCLREAPDLWGKRDVSVRRGILSPSGWTDADGHVAG